MTTTTKGRLGKTGRQDEAALTLRAMPHNFEAEVQLLGSILANNRAMERVADFLKGEHFADERHDRIFRACGLLIDRGAVASAVTLKNYFEQDSTLAEIGGTPYLGKLAASAVTVINSWEHGMIIFELWQRRQMIQIGDDLLNAAYSHDLETPPEQVAARVAQQLDGITGGDGTKGPVHIREGYKQAIEEAEVSFRADGHISGISTGLVDLDKKLGGLHKGNAICIGARPSMGKTALAWGIAKNAALHYREETDDAGKVFVAEGAKVLFFSLEMSLKELAQRDIAEDTGISVEQQRRGLLRGEDFPRIMQTIHQWGHIPLFVDEDPNVTLGQIRQRTRKLIRSQGVGMVVIDYLQLITTDNYQSERRPDNRVGELSVITRGLKTMAKQLGIPVVYLSQLSRKVEERDDKRPMLSDLRESGTIEQDSDVVMFVYRDEYYLEKEKPRRKGNMTEAKHQLDMTNWLEAMEKVRGIAEILIEKNRQGKRGVTVEVAFDGPKTRFSNLIRDDQQPTLSYQPGEN